MKIKIEKLTDKLNITEEFNQSNEEGEQDDET